MSDGVSSVPSMLTVIGPQLPAVLSERDLAVLAIERKPFRFAGQKEKVIREKLDLSATRYYQILNSLLDNPLALAAEPMMINRLRRARGVR